MPNRPGYKPRDARLDLSPRKQLQDALCRKAIVQRDLEQHRRNTSIGNMLTDEERRMDGLA